MALLGESLVEEWLNREGFFTIRGVRHGVDEMDLLAIRREPNGKIIGWHVEVQVSFRPIGFIAKLPKGDPNRQSVRARSSAEVEECARIWVQAKFKAESKQKMRDKLWPGIKWKYHFVHGVVREPHELKVIAKEGVVLHTFHDILTSLSDRKNHSFSGSAGGDIAEIVAYFKTHAA